MVLCYSSGTQRTAREDAFGRRRGVFLHYGSISCKFGELLLRTGGVEGMIVYAMLFRFMAGIVRGNGIFGENTCQEER